MNTKQIRELAEILQSTGLTLLEVCEGDVKIHLEKAPAPVQVVQATPMQQIQAAQAVQTIEPLMGVSPLDGGETAVDFNRITEVKAPMVGVFYAASSPDTLPFVKRGDHVKRGDVLCIIEAMKLMNEIVAEIDGEIADICVQNGQLVEFSQTLYKIF